MNWEGVVVSCITGVVITILGIVVKRLMNTIEKHDNERKNLDAVRNRALLIVINFCISHDHRELTYNKCVSKYVHSVLSEMHKLYHELGGNSTVDRMMRDIDNMHVIDIDGSGEYLKEVMQHGKEKN
jgi:hypothetical protein